MRKITEISEALSRLSCIARTRFHYDPAGQVFGDGAIHYMVEMTGLFFVAWEDSDTRVIIVNPITRFRLDELRELRAEDAWTLLVMPNSLTESIRFREINDAELIVAYRRMEEWALRVGLASEMTALCP